MDLFLIKERLKLALWFVGTGFFIGVFVTWNAWGQIGVAGEGRERYLLSATVTGALVLAWIVLLIATLVSMRRMSPDYKSRPRATNIPWWALKFGALSILVAAMAVVVLKYGDRGMNEFGLLEEGQLGRLKERISGNPELLENRDRKSGKTLLECALESEDAAAVDMLLASGAVLAEVADRLNLAASLDNRPMLEVLLRHGTNPNRPNENRFAPLHLVVAEGNTNALALLLAAGADADVLDPLGQSPLSMAVIADDPPTIQCLLENGANPNLADQRGDTALHKAVRMNKPGICRLLLENGADAKAANLDGQRPLDIAAHNGANELVALFLGDPEMVRWVGKDDLTAFDQAVRGLKFDTARLLLEHGADMNRVMANGYTLTHLLIIAKEYKTAQFLIEAGANVNIPNAEGETALDLMRDKQIKMLLDLVEARGGSSEAGVSNEVSLLESP